MDNYLDEILDKTAKNLIIPPLGKDIVVKIIIWVQSWDPVR